MMKKMIIILIVPTVMLAGCWSKRELNEIGIAAAIGIDKAKEGYLISLQFLDPSSVSTIQGGAKGAPVVTYKMKEKTMFEALRRMVTITPRKIYFPHLRIIIISEEIAREDGIEHLIDFLLRDHEMKKDFYVAIAAKEKAYRLLQVLTPIEKIPASKLFNSLVTAEKSYAPTLAVKLDDVARTLIFDGIDPVISGIRVIGNSKKARTPTTIESTAPKALLEIWNIGIFKKSKLIGWMSLEESKGYNYAIGNVSNTVGSQKCHKNKKGLFVLEVIKETGKIKIDKTGVNPEYTIDIKTLDHIGEMKCIMDVTKESTIKKMEKASKDRITYLVHTAIKRSKKEKVDFLGFGKILKQHDPASWEKVKDRWDDEVLPNLKVKVKVNVKIKRPGGLLNPIQSKKESLK